MQIFDDVLDSFFLYSKNALNLEYSDIPTPAGVFKNIHLIEDANNPLARISEALCPGHKVLLNFIRKSPLNQKEPNYIHSDIDMGDYTVLFYLNNKYPDNEGTIFYERTATKKLKAEDIEDCSDSSQFKESVIVRMRKNRIIVFPAALYHSRALIENFEIDGEPRLVQVLFLVKK